MVAPVESNPDVAVSAPGKPLNRLSTLRFSCTMITMCCIFVIPGGGVGAGVAVCPGVGPAPSEAGPPAQPPAASSARLMATKKRPIFIREHYLGGRRFSLNALQEHQLGIAWIDVVDPAGGDA